MLSILIPTYLRDVLRLVQELHEGATRLGIEFEIICADDASPDDAHLAGLRASGLLGERVRLIALSENIGRARIRNLLAGEARHALCWFMDADMLPPQRNSEELIQNYLSAAHKSSGEFVLCGGHCYSAEPPANKALYLHWWYGSQREVRSAAQRKIQPYASFTTANFVASRSIFEHTQFQNLVNGYGHEDTLFGYALEKRKVPFVHLDNPLEHLGLEPQAAFLAKQRQAVENLFRLSKRVDLSAAPIRLWQMFARIQRWRLAWLLALLFGLLGPLAVWRLQKKSPSLRWLDIYKLSYLCKFSKQK